MAATFLLAFLSAMAVAYALVALATINVWRPQIESYHEGRPERVVAGPAGGTRKRRCFGSARRPPERGRARCSHRHRSD